jgi:putative transposase
MRIFRVGSERDFSFVCGGQGWPNTTKWNASRGDGKALMEAWARCLWRSSAWDPTPPIGGKNGRKRSVLVDARGVPLSLVASGANVHDVKLLKATRENIVYPRPKTNICATESLCMDAGYVGHDAMVTTRNHGYQQNLKSRKQETEEKTLTPGHKARRWVVERTHSWFNRFRKLLVSFEKTEESFIALLSLAAAILCWRQIISIYG